MVGFASPMSDIINPFPKNGATCNEVQQFPRIIPILGICIQFAPLPSRRRPISFSPSMILDATKPRPTIPSKAPAGSLRLHRNCAAGLQQAHDYCFFLLKNFHDFCFPEQCCHDRSIRFHPGHSHSYRLQAACVLSVYSLNMMPGVTKSTPSSPRLGIGRFHLRRAQAAGTRSPSLFLTMTSA